MDPISAAASAGTQIAKVSGPLSDETAKATSNLLVRLFGPSADVIGANWADKLREKNLARLIGKTEKRAKLQQRARQDPGIANPRVASQAFASAEYSDSEVVAEYLSGVLASSRDATGRSDAGVAWSTLIARLSSDQLKLHYFIYASARQRAVQKSLSSPNELHNVGIVLDHDPFIGPADMTMAQFGDAVDGLMREGLIGEGYRYGPATFLFERELLRPGFAVHYPHATGLRVRLTVHGVRLFVWGTGYGDKGIEAYADPSIDLSAVDDPPPIVTAFLVEDEVIRAETSQSVGEGVEPN